MKKFNNSLHLMARSTYTGENISTYLVKFKRETTDHLKERTKLVSYDNMIKPIVDSLVDPIFAMGVYRETQDSILNKYWLDTNRLKDNIDTIMRDAAIGYTLHGNGFIICDNFSDFIGRTKEEQAELRELPWSRYRDMTELYAYETNEVDTIVSLEFYNGTNEGGDNLIIGYDDTNVYRYTEDEDDMVVVPHGLNYMPVITLDGKISEIPSMKDICTSNISLFNKQSELRNIERESAWVVMDLPSDDDIDTLLLRQFNVMRTDPNGRGLSFHSPDSSVLIGLQNSVKQAKDNIEDQASRLGSVASKTSTQSGEALKMEFLGQSYKLKALSHKLTAVDEELIKMVSDFANMVFEYETEYPTDFVDPVATKSAEIEVLQKVVTLITSLENTDVSMPMELKTYLESQLKLLAD